MPVLSCPRCRRTNPNEAVFCYYDGAELRPAHGGARLPAGQLPHEFVFPSGRRCKSFDDLVQGCQYEWEEARDLLKDGTFGKFLSSIGRMDLSRAAQQAQARKDADIALHEFVGRLPLSPSQPVQGPRLDLSPRRLALGTLRSGETRQVRLTVSNLGKGLLRGTLTVADGDSWLKLAEGGNHCPLMTARDQQITLWVDTTGLPAPQSYNAKLTVITNGGIVEVPVGFDLTAYGFAHPPFQGVASAREMAERMRAQPKAAVPLLENGEVARWFEANSWTYPVQGPPAKGVAAVQQFFEGMGLSKPPTLQVSESEFHYSCMSCDVIRGQVVLRTPAKKWVYGNIDSDRPWLKVTTPSVSGPQQAVIAFEVDAELMEPGDTHLGTLSIAANAGQKLQVRVRVDVQRPQEPFTRRLLRPWLAGLLLAMFYRLLLAVPVDLYARVLAAPANAAQKPGSFATWLQSPALDGGFIRHFVLGTWWLGAILGAVLLWRRGSRWADVVCGTIAGAVAGIFGSATLACVWPLFDGIPRTVWAELKALSGNTAADFVWLWTALWIGLAVVSWGAAGAVVGLVLGSVGPRGIQLLQRLGQPLTWVCRLCGLKRAVALLAMQS